MDSTLKILVVEDNADIAANIGDFLVANGHIVDFAHDGELAIELATHQEFDLVILDIMLPRLDGYAVARHLRSVTGKYVPILMLTAKDTLDNILAGFEAGADDYLIKPFSLEELYARIKAQAGRLRRQEKHLMHWGDISVDVRTGMATIDTRPLITGRTGFLILQTLVRNGSEMVAREALETQVWGDSPPDSDALRSHIYCLRKQLRASNSSCEILTVHGQGFRLSDGKSESPV